MKQILEQIKAKISQGVDEASLDSLKTFFSDIKKIVFSENSVQKLLHPKLKRN